MTRREEIERIKDHISKDISPEQNAALAMALIAEMLHDRSESWPLRLRRWCAQQLQPISIPGVSIESVEQFNEQIVRLILQAERALQMPIDVVVVRIAAAGRVVEITTHE